MRTTPHFKSLHVHRGNAPYADIYERDIVDFKRFESWLSYEIHHSGAVEIWSHYQSTEYEAARTGTSLLAVYGVGHWLKITGEHT